MLFSSIALLFKLYIDSSTHTNTIDILPYYIVLFFVGLARGFMGPSLQALWADFIPKELFPNGATWSANTFNFGAVAGPALGGVVLGFYGANAAAILTCLLLISSIIAFLRLKYKKVIRDIKKEPLKDKLLAGLRFVFSHQILVGAMALDMFAVMFGGAIALLPAFVKDVLLMGPEALGILRAAPFIGSLLMGIYLAHHPPLRNTGKILLISIAGFGVCIIGFAMSTHYLLSLLLLAASGAFDNVSMVIRGSIAQLFTPDEMRGRVSAVNGVFIGSSNEIGAFESGLAASLMGLIPSVIFGGSITIIIVLCTAIFIPALATFSIRTSMHNNQT
jgi:MFS family permease